MIPDNPFAPDTTRRSFLETLGAGEALRRLEDALGAREPFLLVTGEPGTGKTALAHEAIARWETRVTAAFLAYPALTGAELLEEIVLRFGAQPADGASRPKLVACLERALADIAGAGRVAMIVVDDAHRLPTGLLEELRLLVNAARQAGQPLEVLLLGLPSIEAALDDPALAALRQRVSVRARLEPLSEGETRRYLRHRVGAAGGDGPGAFPRKACAELFARSGGVPREINALASAALRLARASGGASVTPELVKSAAAELKGELPARAPDDAGEADREDAPAAADASPPHVPHTAPLPSLAPSPSLAPAPAPAPSPAPAARPRRVEVAAPHAMAEAAPPAPAPPTSHDPREWVSRFVGDRGPIQIGSQVGARVNWTPEPSEAPAAHAPGGAVAPRPHPAAAIGGGSRSRSRRARGLRTATAAVLVTSVVVAAVVLGIRAGAFGPKRAHPTAAATTTATTPKRAEPARASTAPVVVTRVPATKPAATGAAAAAELPVVSPNGRYTLEVGGYVDLQAALEERDRVEELAGIEGWVIPSPEGAAGLNRIVLGIYRSRERATAAARMLTGTRTLGEVKVVPLPPRSSRL